MGPPLAVRRVLLGVDGRDVPGVATGVESAEVVSRLEPLTDFPR